MTCLHSNCHGCCVRSRRKRTATMKRRLLCPVQVTVVVRIRVAPVNGVKTGCILALYWGGTQRICWLLPVGVLAIHNLASVHISSLIFDLCPTWILCYSHFQPIPQIRLTDAFGIFAHITSLLRKAYILSLAQSYSFLNQPSGNFFFLPDLFFLSYPRWDRWVWLG